MKTIREFVKLSVILTCLILSSCTKDEVITLEVDQNVLTFEPGVETKSFQLISSGEWHITSEELSQYYGPNMSCTDWFEISPVFGDGNARIEITTKPDSHDNSIILHIAYGKNEKTVTLNQN